MDPCLRFLTAVELLIKRLMIKLSKRDSWAELLPMSDRGHDLPSQPRMPPPAENRPCLDMVPRLLELLTALLAPVFLMHISCLFIFKSQVHEIVRKDTHCDPSTVNNCHFLWIRINSPWFDLVNIRFYSENIKAVVFIIESLHFFSLDCPSSPDEDVRTGWTRVLNVIAVPVWLSFPCCWHSVFLQRRFSN